MKDLTPDARLLAVQYIVRYFVASMRRQTVHQDRVFVRQTHQGRVHLKVGQVETSTRRLLFEAHRDPRVGVDDIRAHDGVVDAVGATQHPRTTHGGWVFGAPRGELVALGRAHVDVDAQTKKRDGQGARDVRRVTDVGDRQVRERVDVTVRELLRDGEYVRDGLRGVRHVTQEIDEREPLLGRRAHSLEDTVLANSQCRDGVHLGDRASDVLRRLAAIETDLHVAEEGGVAAQFVHGR